MQFAGTTPTNPHQQWQFNVEIGGFPVGLFTECSGVKFENKKSRFAPAGSMQDQKLPGRIEWDDVTLKKGKLQDGTDNAVLQWQAQIANVAAGNGGLPSDFLREVDIVEYSRDEKEVRRYRLYGAWLSKGELGEYKGDSEEPTVESLTITYQYAEQVA